MKTLTLAAMALAASAGLTLPSSALGAGIDPAGKFDPVQPPQPTAR